MAYETEQRANGLVEAGVRIFESAQQLVLDRIDLLRYELRADLRSTVLGVATMAAGGVLTLLGWVVLMAAFVASGWLPPAVALAIVGGAQLLLGAAGIVFAMRTLGSLELVPPDGFAPPKTPREPM
jgi:membrane-bound ClpP family serine protease